MGIYFIILVIIYFLEGIGKFFLVNIMSLYNTSKWKHIVEKTLITDFFGFQNIPKFITFAWQKSPKSQIKLSTLLTCKLNTNINVCFFKNEMQNFSLIVSLTVFLFEATAVRSLCRWAATVIFVETVFFQFKKLSSF